MKLKNQLIISIVILSSVFLIIFASFIFTNQQVTQLNNQEQVARNIQTRASDLNYLSNDFFLYQQNPEVPLFESKISSLSNDLSQINPANSAWKILLTN